MSPELALLSETWDIVKTYIPRKERLEVAESLLKSFDSAMKAAIKSHFDYLLDTDGEDDDYNTDWD